MAEVFVYAIIITGNDCFLFLSFEFIVSLNLANAAMARKKNNHFAFKIIFPLIFLHFLNIEFVIE